MRSMAEVIWQSIQETLRAFSTPERPVYLVGGAVRDLLLGKAPHDLDFVLPGPTRKLADELACRMNGALYVLDEERDTTRVVLSQGSSARILVDFASLRGADLDTDLRGRDFTINAMAYDLAQPNHLIDPTGGLADLQNKILRACSSHSLGNDPVRVLRAVRLALALGCRIEHETLQQMRSSAPLLLRVSAERQRDELFKIFDGAQVALAMRILEQVGALQVILPELEALQSVTQSAPHIYDVWEHTLRVVDYLEQILRPLTGAYDESTVRDLTVGSAVLWLGRFRQQLASHFQTSLINDRTPRALLFLAALYHDVSKPETRVEMPDGRIRFLNHPELGAGIAAHRGRALALSVVEVERLKKVVEHHMRVHHLADGLHRDAAGRGAEHISRRSIYRYFRDTGEAGVDLCLLSLADTRGTYGMTLPQPVWEAELQACRMLLEAYWEKSDEVVSPVRYLSGNDLIKAFDLTPGPLVGRLLDAIREAQAAGEINDREEALLFAREWLAQNAAAEYNRQEGKD